MIACEKGYIELVDHILDNHAQVNYLGGPKNCHPLHYAINSQAENVDVVDLLIEKGKAEVNSANLDGLTPLLLACQKKYS